MPSCRTSSNCQLTPLSVFNFLLFDQKESDSAKMVVSIGAENTDLLIVHRDSLWSRCLPIAGNDFTRAIQRAFSTNFENAEQLKRNAHKSPHAKKIYEAMTPVLRGLVNEIQRSIGFYKSVKPSVAITDLVPMGNAFKVQGMGKFLAGRLNLAVKRIESLSSFDVDRAKGLDLFQANTGTFANVLGLVVQGCGLAKISSSLLPEEIVRRKLMEKKKPFAFATAAVFLAMVAVLFLRSSAIAGIIASKKPFFSGLETVVRVAAKQKSDYESAINVSSMKKEINGLVRLYVGRAKWIPMLKRILKHFPDEPKNTVWVTGVKASMVGEADELTVEGFGRSAGGGLDMGIPMGMSMGPGMMGPGMMGARGSAGVRSKKDAAEFILNCRSDMELEDVQNIIAGMKKDPLFFDKKGNTTVELVGDRLDWGSGKVKIDTRTGRRVGARGFGVGQPGGAGMGPSMDAMMLGMGATGPGMGLGQPGLVGEREEESEFIEERWLGKFQIRLSIRPAEIAIKIRPRESGPETEVPEGGVGQ